jgi:hypothetical protein
MLSHCCKTARLGAAAPEMGRYGLGTSATGSADSDLPAAGRFDGSLGLRSELFSISFRVRHVDFRNEIYGRFGLGMQALDRNRANRDASEH